MSPPLTSITAPVTKEASSLAKNSTAAGISSGSPSRPVPDPATLTLCPDNGYLGYFLGIACSRILPGLLCFAYFLSGKWKTRKLLVREKE